MSFYCATQISGTFTAWLCQEGYFLHIIILWRELSLFLRLNLEVLNMHLSFAHFRVAKLGNYLVLLTRYLVFRSTMTKGFLVIMLACSALKGTMGYLIITLLHLYIYSVQNI